MQGPDLLHLLTPRAHSPPNFAALWVISSPNPQLELFPVAMSGIKTGISAGKDWREQLSLPNLSSK